MSKQSIAWLALLCACSVDPEGGMPFTGGADGGATATPENDDEDTGATEESSGTESGSADADADPATTAAADDSTGDASATITTTDATSGAAGSSGDGAASLDEGGDDDAGEDDAYQACVGNDECTSDPGLACLTAENGGEGFCSPSCGAMGASPPDPQLCPDAPPGITATVVCLEGFLIRNCALSCAGGLTCPDGTECLPANGGAGPYCFGSGA